MPEFYNDDTMMVDEADDWAAASDEFFVDEADDQESMMVEEESLPPATVDLVPGSEMQFVEEDDVVEQKAEDWVNDGDHSKFVGYVKDKLTKIPKHSGETVPGCERAKSYLKSIDKEISQAMRTDLDGNIDEREVDALRKEIQNMVDRLEKQLKKLTVKSSVDVKLVSNGQCGVCNSSAPMWNDVANDKLVCMSCNSGAQSDESIEKQASTPVLNVYVTAFERAVVGTIINSSVSAGRNIEETYEKLKNKYNFTPRECLAIQQLVSDYGYPVYKDRGMLDEPSDPAANDGVDWAAQYHA